MGGRTFDLVPFVVAVEPRLDRGVVEVDGEGWAREDAKVRGSIRRQFS